MTKPQRQYPAAALSRDDLQPAQVARICVLHRDPHIQRAIVDVQREVCRLVEASGLGLMAQALERAGGEAIEHITPAQVLAGLHELRDEAVAEAALAADERALHARTFRDALAPILMLRDLVSQRGAQAKAEAWTLRQKVQALSEWRPGQPNDRAVALRQHLSDEQLAALGVVDNPTQVAELKERLVTLDATVRACDAFCADDHFDPRHLDGLGFESDIDAARAAGAVLPAWPSHASAMPRRHSTGGRWTSWQAVDRPQQFCTRKKSAAVSRPPGS
ncbi:hypothetical protein [Roseateles sp.]|uniref:hypothetical protein n=1 Tax=Roseateles sp. TaxID=1971397 RepID=UPI0032645158